MQTGFQPGQFRTATVQMPTNSPASSTVLSNFQPNQVIQGDVLSATLQQVSKQNQSIAQYKAQILIQGKTLDIVTQFPLDKGDKLELKVTNNQQLSIEKVVANNQRSQTPSAQSTQQSIAAELNKTTLNTSIPNSAGKTETPSQLTPQPITQEQVNNVVKLWLTQSRPAAGTLIDLSITFEAMSEIIKQLPNSPFNQNLTTTIPSSGDATAKPLPLSNLLMLIAQTIEKDIFQRLPHSGQSNFKEHIQQLVKELISWQALTPNVKQPTSPQSPSPTNDARLPPISNPLGTNAGGNTTPQQTIITALVQLQSTLEQALAQATLPKGSETDRAATSPNPTSLNSTSQNSTHIPILRDWTQVLSLMSPTTQSQSDLVDWMLESIRRISGSNTPQAQETTITLAMKGASQNQNTVDPSLISAASRTKESTINAQTNHLSTPTNSVNSTTTPLTDTQRIIDSSQWLKLAEFRKHQLFTGSIKQSLLQGTSELQISNVLRQMMVTIEELTGRMTALRLASAANQVDTTSPTQIHLDIPILTANGPTAVTMDIAEERQDKADGEKSRQIKSQWLVHLKFELPPLATFVGQVIYDVDQKQLTANFYTDHKETLSVLNQHLNELEHQCRPHIQSDITLNTRFGMIEMPRESIVKKTTNVINEKV